MEHKKTVGPLSLKNQVCFPIYAVSRQIVNAYGPLLKSLGLTYPQYLCMLILWEEDCRTIGQFSYLLMLDTNTLSPLLKRLEVKGFVERRRHRSDERKTFVYLTELGRDLKSKAESIPESLLTQINVDRKRLEDVGVKMWELLNTLRYEVQEPT